MPTKAHEPYVMAMKPTRNEPGAADPATGRLAAAVALRDVRKVYGRGEGAVVALDGVSAALFPGSFTAIMGPSGSGKSTFLNVAAGLDRPTSGSVMLGGTTLDKLSEQHLTILRRDRVGFVFQAFNLLPSLTVAQNIGLPLRLGGHRPGRSAVREIAARVGLEKRLRDRPSQLSGGQQQRVAIARALITRPEVVFADEPTGALDTRTGQEVLSLLREVVDQDRHTVVMVTHDPMAAAYAHRVMLLADGRVAGILDAPSADEVAERLAHLGALPMLFLAVLNARGRLGTFTGALVALFAAAVLSMAWGMQLESILRTHSPVERYAGAAAVVTGQQEVGDGVLLGERARVSSALAQRLAAVPGVRAAIGDVSVPALLGDRTVVAHGWSSAVLTPYVLTAGRPPARPGEVVTGYPAALGARLVFADTGPAYTVTVVGVALPSHPVSRQTAIFLTDAEATRLAGHPGFVDAIGVLAAPGFDVSRLRAAVGGAQVLTGNARGAAEYPEFERNRQVLIPVTAAFGGLSMFIAVFVVASTLGLSIQQREREIALLRAVAATPGQIRRMIAWEAAIVALAGSAAGIWPGIVLGRALAQGLLDWLPAAAAIGGGVATALLAVLAAGHRAARVPPTLALTDAAAEPWRLGPGRVIGGLIALAGAVPLFAVSVTTTEPQTAEATSEIDAIFLVVAVAFLGPVASYAVARLLAPALTALSPVGGFLASANLGGATRRFSSASTPIVLTVALSCTFLFGFTTVEHATSQQQRAALTGQLVITSAGPGLPDTALADARATPGVRSAVALTSTTLGPCLGVADDLLPAQILTGGQGGGLDVGVIAGSLSALHGDTIALGQHRAAAVHARVGGRVAIMLGDGTQTQATVVAIYARDLAFGDVLLAPELAAGHQTTPLLNEILIQADEPAAVVAGHLRALAHRYRGLQVSDSASLVTANAANDELSNWLGPFFVATIFAFTSIAALNTLIMIALRRRRELALLRLTGATTRQVLAMARWEATLVIVIGLGLGLAITATALLPLSHALTGGFRPYAPAGWLAVILGVSALLALVGLSVPTRQALRTRPVEAIGIRD
jgi:putative ABC transport system permease protein